MTALKNKDLLPLPKTPVGLIIFSLVVATIAGVALLAVSLHIPALHLLRSIYDNYYFPFTNSATVRNIGGIHLHLLLYLFMIMATFAVFILLTKRPRQSPSPSVPFSSALTTAGLYLLALVSILQFSNHLKIFRNEFLLFSPRTVEERQRFIHQEVFDFARFCTARLPGRHRALIISDLNMEIEPALTIHEKLRYFLFPAIDIGLVYAGQDVDCLIFYKKKNAAIRVPEDYEILGQYNSSSLIAVKKR